jgi:ATP-dependent Clp protease protease subunit
LFGELGSMGKRRVIAVVGLVAFTVVGAAVVFFGSRSRNDVPQVPGESERLLRERVVLLDGDLDDQRATEIIAKLLFLQHQHPQQPITVRIDSPGGSAVAGLAIVDAIRDLSAPVHTRCTGRAEGIALVILAAGLQGRRSTGVHSELALAPIVGADGAGDENMARVRGAVVQLLAERCHQRPDIIDRDLLAGRVFKPSAASEYGLVDRIEE